MENRLDEIKNIEINARENNIPIALDDTAMFIADLCSKRKPENILEIGTAVGYSGLIMLLNSGDRSMLTTIEKDEKMFLKARENFKSFNIEPRTMQYLGDAIEILPWLEENSYNMIFLDGPKGQYKNYLPYLVKLLKKGGVLVADNVYFKGMLNKDAQVPKKLSTLVKNLREFNNLVTEHKDFKTTFLEIGDGVCVCEKL